MSVAARRLDGKAMAEARRSEIARRAGDVAHRRGTAPRLVVVLATQDEAALTYAQAKERLGGKIGVRVDVARPAVASTDELVAAVQDLGADPSVDGILIATPLSRGFEARKVQNAVPVEKDVDGAAEASLGKLLTGQPGFVPATAEAVIALLEGHGVAIDGRHAVVVGRSLTVGRPLAQLLLTQGATVTTCHSRTSDLAVHTLRADVLCVAAGRPRLVTGAMVRPGAVVVDVGTTVVDEVLTGDVDYPGVAAVAEAVSPVPGGVGPLTSVLLLEHVVRAAEAALR
ncbi:MAG: bifunctional 5,10-methylenetetrahydrofolate dehydrogenase/5,10-methenyltetrahydrofolate cyclohydrolase [Candidatus Bipolaricaulota bacterium]